MTYWIQHSASSIWLEEFPAFELLQSYDISQAVCLQMSDRWSVTNILVIYGHQLNHWDEVRGTLELMYFVWFSFFEQLGKYFFHRLFFRVNVISVPTL